MRKLLSSLGLLFVNKQIIINYGKINIDYATSLSDKYYEC